MRLASAILFLLALAASGATGLNGSPMLSFESTLTREQRWEIIAWIFTLKLPDVPSLGNGPKR